MTLADLLISLRQRLLDARNQGDTAQATDLWITFDTLLEVSYPHKRRALSMVLQHLVDSALDTLNGEEWKSTIPTVEHIKQAYAETLANGDT